MAKVNWEISKKVDAFGQSELSIRFIGGQYTILRTGSRIKIDADRWKKDSKQIIMPKVSKLVGTPGYELYEKYRRINEKMNDLAKAIIDSFVATHSDDINIEWLKEVIDRFHFPEKYMPVMEVEQRVTFKSFVSEFIANSASRQSDGKFIDKKTPYQYKIAFSHFLDFCAYKGVEYDFNDIDEDFYRDFTAYLMTEKQLAKSTIGAKVKNIKLFLSESRQYHHNEVYKGFKVTKEPGDEIALTAEERNIIYNLDLSSDLSLDRVRDWFLLLCCCGCRYSDLLNISRWDRDGDLFVINQEKTDDVAYIPIHPIVESIIQKYCGNIPTPISNQKFNDAIKQVAKLAELNQIETKYRTIGGQKVAEKLVRWQRVSSHTGRRTFATIEYRNGTPIQSIMAVTGHKTEESLINYIKVDKREHAQHLMGIWRKQREDEKLIDKINALSYEDRERLISTLL